MNKQKHFYLVRGLIREKGHWKPLIQELQEHFPEAKITTIDIPGAGEHVMKTSPLTISTMVEEMRQEYLAKKKEGELSLLIAISLGGMIAVEWMKKYPEDFQHATLINTSLGSVSKVYERLMPSAFVHLLKVPFLKGRAKEARILRLVSNHKQVFDKTLNHWEEIQRERPVTLPNTLRQLFAAAWFGSGNFRPPMPVTLLASVHDRMVNVSCSRDLAKKWDAPILEHPTGGHDLSVDDPAWVVLKLKDSIAKF
jgi:pimeloyl-ACP methyl ester carboxylesterase